MRLAELVGSSGSSANDREEIGFAKDSPLEGNGFEISVPRQIGSGFEASVGLGPIGNRRGGITRAVVGLVNR
jgi:hypothetical protein